MIQRRNQVNPKRAEPWCQHRHRDHQAPAQAETLRHDPHDFGVAHDVSATDVQSLPGRAWLLKGRDEIVQDVAHRDRLALGPHPARRDHHRQPLD